MPRCPADERPDDRAGQQPKLHAVGLQRKRQLNRENGARGDAPCGGQGQSPCKGVSATRNPFEVLGLNAGASADDVRNAYRQLVKTCHPDKFLDADERKAAQEKMIALNLAYEEALKLTASRRSAATNYNRELTEEEAIALADKMLHRDSPESALRQLMRTKQRGATWYAMQGRVLMALEQYESAHQSYREAVKREPNNNVFRQGALDAAVALKKSRTVAGRVKVLLKRLKKH